VLVRALETMDWMFVFNRVAHNLVRSTAHGTTAKLVQRMPEAPFSAPRQPSRRS
jgi:hypothetical protein